jgi:hypothetical protein
MSVEGEHVSEIDPEGFKVGGLTHEWKTGRMPESEQDWITEYRLLLQDIDAVYRLAGRKDDEREQLAIRVASLTEQNEQLKAEGAGPAFHLGKRPETSDEIEAEVRLRELERRWEVELADRKHRADLNFQQSGLIRRAEGIRGWALVAVVFAIIASPWVAMIADVAAKDFSLYVTPVTGIAGAIIGYWFGQGQQNPLQPPTIANYQTPVPLSHPQQPGAATPRP